MGLRLTGSLKAHCESKKGPAIHSSLDFLELRLINHARRRHKGRAARKEKFWGSYYL